MKVGVVSDTHLPRFGDRLPAELCRGLSEERVALILHLGDFTGSEIPRLLEAVAPLEAVAGNNDPPDIVQRFGRRRIVTLGGVRVGMVHGDGTHGTTTSRSLRAFEEDEVDVICFGHSHQPDVRAARWDLAREPWLSNRQAGPESVLLRDSRHQESPRRAAPRILRSNEGRGRREDQVRGTTGTEEPRCPWEIQLDVNAQRTG